MSENSKDNYLGGLRKDSELCTESLFFIHQSVNPKNVYHKTKIIYEIIGKFPKIL